MPPGQATLRTLKQVMHIGAIVLLQVAVNSLSASPSVYVVPAQDVCCSIDGQREGALKAYGMIMQFM